MTESNIANKTLDSLQKPKLYFPSTKSILANNSKRIQRKRTKGWRMPENAVYVGRPSKYGNPYAVNSIRTRDEAVKEYAIWLHYKLNMNPNFLDKLRGKDLACWCPLTDKNGNPVPCHADVLLKFLKEVAV